MRMWAGSLTRVTPSFVQVMVALAESAVQYSQITDCSTMLWTPLLFWKRMSGRGVMASWALAAKDEWEKMCEGESEGQYVTPLHHTNHGHVTPNYLTAKLFEYAV